MKAFCPFCEKEYNNLEVQTRYEITTLNGVTAEWQKKYIACPDCGEELYNGKLHDANLRVVYAACKVSDIYKPVADLCNYVLKLRMENAELRERLDKAVGLPRIVHPNANEWFVQYQNEYGLIFDEIFYSERAAEARLKEIQEENDDDR